MPIGLSPIDHLFTGKGAYPINFVFLFNGKLEAARVEDSLAKVAQIFSPVRSRLENRGDHSYEFRENTKGYAFHFQKLASEVSMDDLGSLSKLLNSVQSLPGHDLLSVTLSHCGERSCLGVSISHSVVDGYAYFMFLNAWAQTLQGKAPSAPDLERSKLEVEKFESTPLNEKIIFEQTGFSFVEERRPVDGQTVSWEVLHLSKEELSHLYKKVSSETQIRLSMNDVLMADLWRKFALKHQKPGETLRLSCAYDFRRVYPKISAAYFGNAVRCAAFELEYSELVESSPVRIATLVNQAVRSIDEKAVEAALSCVTNLRRQRGLSAMEQFHVAHPQRGFLLTNLSRLPVLDLDFGTGVPVDFAILTPARRTAVVLPGKHGDGLRVQIAL